MNKFVTEYSKDANGKWTITNQILCDSPIMAMVTTDLYGLGFDVIVVATQIALHVIGPSKDMLQVAING